MKRFYIFTVLTLFCLPRAFSQKNFAEKLGYPRDAKLLIVTGNGAGLSRTADSAIVTAVEQHRLTSVNIIVTSPEYADIAAYAKVHPGVDWGVQLTLISDKKTNRWAGVSPSEKIPTLLDVDGYFYPTVSELLRHAKPDEIETELMAQIEKADASGIVVTHIDCYMDALYASPQLFKIYQKVAHYWGLPARILPRMAGIESTINNIRLDGVSIIRADGVYKDYEDTVGQIKPGLNELVVNFEPIGDSPTTAKTGATGSSTTQQGIQMDGVTNNAFRAVLEKQDIHLVSWGKIQSVMWW